MLTCSYFNLSMLTVFFAILLFPGREEWGFYGHREINRQAVFTLPPPLIGFYKKNINFITEHAVDPDKRRFASKYEAVRHYIDIDHWGKYPFDNIPRNYQECILKFGKLHLLNPERSDTLTLSAEIGMDSIVFRDLEKERYHFSKWEFMQYFNRRIYPLRYEDLWALDIREDTIWSGGFERLIIEDQFSEYGILPFALMQAHYRLVNAFKARDEEAILRISTDYGHYIADAHVPLHTTENYNGQLTGQEGIHAFWESRLPELYANREYDLFVGKADYIADLEEYFWDIVLDSHAEVDEVLSTEVEIRAALPGDKIYCYEDRNGIVIRTQCPEFARAYSDAMEGMVEDRYRAAIGAIGDLWFTAWVQAGKPDLEMDVPEVHMVNWDTVEVNESRVGRLHIQN